MATQARVDTIVRGGQVVTSSQVLDAAVAIQGDKIVAVAPEHLLPPADRVIDAEGKFVLPGLIDAHVHLDGHDDYALGAPGRGPRRHDHAHPLRQLHPRRR